MLFLSWVDSIDQNIGGSALLIDGHTSQLCMYNLLLQSLAVVS